MKRKKLLPTIFGLTLVIMLYAACTAPTPSPTPTPIPPTSMPPPARQIGPLPVTPQPIFSPIALNAKIDWSMEDRFGLDQNKNGRLDLPNTQAHIHNLTSQACSNSTLRKPLLAVTFDASSSTAYRRETPRRLQEITINRYKWMLSRYRTEETWQSESTEPQWTVCLEEGIYTVMLTIEAGAEADLSSATATQIVPVEDLLIVSIGDSYVSGEGNPEKRWDRCDGDICNRYVMWADDGSPDADSAYELYQDCGGGSGVGSGSVCVPYRAYAVTTESAEHIRAHRSTLSAPAQMALAIENADSHTSVTFVSVAATGATINLGLVGQQEGFMLSQLEQVRRLVGNRQIDALLISVGGNDIGFANVIATLIVREPDDVNVSFDEINRALYTGNWESVQQTIEPLALRGNLPVIAQLIGLAPTPWSGYLPGLSRLGAAYKKLNDTILDPASGPRNILQVYITQYPNPLTTVNEEGEFVYCSKVLDQVAPISGFEVGPEEIIWADEHVIKPLNNQLIQSANEHKWIAVLGIEDDSLGHGLCNPSPYGQDTGYYPGNPFPAPVGQTSDMARWFRRGKESAWIQGPAEPGKTRGIAHPNEFEHQAVKNRILENLVLPVEIPGIGIADRDDQISEARSVRDQTHLGDVSLADDNTYLWPATDVDMFQVYISKNEHIKISATSSTDPNTKMHLRLFNQGGQELKETPEPVCYHGGIQIEGNITQGPTQRAEPVTASFTISEAGYYTIGISAKGNDVYEPLTGLGKLNPIYGLVRQDASPGRYWLSLSTSTSQPDNTFLCANRIGPGVWEGFAIESGRDVDIFQIEVTAGKHYIFDVSPTTFTKPGAPTLPEINPQMTPIPGISGLDPELRLFDAAGQVLATAGRRLEYDFAVGGIYYLGVSGRGREPYNPTGEAPSRLLPTDDSRGRIPVTRIPTLRPSTTVGSYKLSVQTR